MMETPVSPARLLILALAAQNLALGIPFGSYGMLMTEFIKEFDASRSLAGSGLAVTSIVMGILSPWVGKQISHRDVFRVMASGALSLGLGYVLLSVASSMVIVLASYVFIGFGMVMLGPIPAMSIVNKAFRASRGRAMGLVMMPIGIFVVPLIVDVLIGFFQWRVVAALIGLLFLSTIFIWRSASGCLSARDNNAKIVEPMVSEISEERQDFRLKLSRAFIVPVTGYAIIAGAGVAVTAHLVPFGVDMGFGSHRSAWLMSAFGFFAMWGSMIFGWISDYSRASYAFLINCLLHIMGLLLLATSPKYTSVIIAACIIGLCVGGLTASISAKMSELYDPERFPRALGVSLSLNLPFTVGTGPVLGLIYDFQGQYQIAFLSLAFFYLIPVFIFLYDSHVGANPRYVPSSA